MNLRGIVVCVDCSDLLRKSLQRWHVGLDRLVVVTSTRDVKTHALCDRLNVEMHQTDVFYANGASFNKGAAMSEAVLAKRLREGADWLMTFDADIVPPEDWRDKVERAGLQPGNIYGAYRYMAPEDTEDFRVDGRPRMPQGWVIGFFVAFHASDPMLPPADHPLFDIHWPHAGNYDTIFCRRWRRSNQFLLPDLKLIHLGEERQNWTGRFNGKELKEVLARRRSNEDWDRERMANPPVLYADGVPVWPKAGAEAVPA
jgi:hypothetical protein